MKNYYKLLDLPNDTSPQHLIQGLQELQTSQPELVVEATAILLSHSRRAEYTLIHAQYQSITKVVQNMGQENVLDTNNWSGRLGDFNARN